MFIGLDRLTFIAQNIFLLLSRFRKRNFFTKPAGTTQSRDFSQR